MKKKSIFDLILLGSIVLLTTLLFSTKEFLFFWMYMAGMSTLFWFLTRRPKSGFSQFVRKLF